jgi:hypothetical protein
MLGSSRVPVEFGVMARIAMAAFPMRGVGMVRSGFVGGMGMSAMSAMGVPLLLSMGMELNPVVPVAVTAFPMRGVGMVRSGFMGSMGVSAMSAVGVPSAMVASGVPVMMVAAPAPMPVGVSRDGDFRAAGPVLLDGPPGTRRGNVLAPLPVAVFQPAPQFIQAGPGTGGRVVLVVAVLVEINGGVPFLLGA